MNQFLEDKLDLTGGKSSSVFMLRGDIGSNTGLKDSHEARHFALATAGSPKGIAKMWRRLLDEVDNISNIGQSDSIPTSVYRKEKR